MYRKLCCELYDHVRNCRAVPLLEALPLQIVGLGLLVVC